MTIVVFWLPDPRRDAVWSSGDTVSSFSSGMGAQYSLSTFFSCGRRIGLELKYQLA